MEWTYRRPWQRTKGAKQNRIQYAPPHEPCERLNGEYLKSSYNGILTCQISFIVALEKESSRDRSNEEYPEWRHCCETATSETPNLSKNHSIKIPTVPLYVQHL